jgi:hypothetical protein
MNTRNSSLICRSIIVFIFLVLLTVRCLAVEFSADATYREDNAVGKFYVKGDKIRQEITSKGVKLITIRRPDKQLVWVINPAQRTYMVQRGGRIDWLTESALAAYHPEIFIGMFNAGHPSKQIVGKQKLSGFDCQEYLYSYAASPGYELRLWKTNTIDWPLKLEMKRPNRKPPQPKVFGYEFKNVRIGKVSDALFELPKGYKEIPLPKINSRRS